MLIPNLSYILSLHTHVLLSDHRKLTWLGGTRLAPPMQLGLSICISQNAFRISQKAIRISQKAIRNSHVAPAFHTWVDPRDRHTHINYVHASVDMWVVRWLRSASQNRNCVVQQYLSVKNFTFCQQKVYMTDV
jgi:hypothetical protein